MTLACWLTWLVLKNGLKLESKKSFSTREREAGLAHSSMGSVVTFR